MKADLQEARPFAAHAPDRDRPLGGYALLTSAFLACAGGFSAWLRRSNRQLPERVTPGDLALITVASHKASRLLAKDRVTSTVRAPFTRFQEDGAAGEVEEEARGRGLQRAIGELVTCPYCLGLWISAGFNAGLVVAPRVTRFSAALLAVTSGSDTLQILYKRLEGT